MNDYAKDLHFDIILPRLKMVSYKQVLMTCAKEAQKHCGISAQSLYEILLNKENEASSGIGENIAIPHLQILGPQRPFTLLATLEHPIDFNALDNQPVDLVGFVLSPQADGPCHLRRLSRISRLLKCPELRQKLHETPDEIAMHALLVNPNGWLLAA
ncbi:MAG: PTS sugar transporter subunit IIA [Rhodospirillales bacterium]|nr:PTS sugar transporter subunit IIA [Rhodospirillales bacterium]